MQFLAPLFWLAAVAVTVPILLHLTRKEQKRPVPFASLMFLRRIPIRDLRKNRLKHLLLLALRCLALLLLVAAFARPVVTSLWLQAANPLASRSVVILVDHSMSMSRGGTWERALQAVEAQIRSLDDSDEGMILQFGETAKMLTSWERDRQTLLQAARGLLAPSFEKTAYTEGLKMAAEQFRESRNADQVIHLITDLQRSGLTSASDWELPPGVRLEIEDVGEGGSNRYIDEVRLDRDVFSDQYPHPILVRVASSPPEPSRGEVLLHLNGELIDRAPFELGENGTATVTLSPFKVPEGVSRGRLVLQPGDELSADDVYTFVLEKHRPSTVSVLSSPQQSSLLYFRNALSSGTNRPFAVEAVSVSRLRSLDPRESPVLVLDDQPSPPDPSLVTPFLEQGGGIILVLGNSVSPEAYRRWGELLPVEILERNYVRSRSRPFTAMTDILWEHPVFSIFQGAGRNALVGIQFYSYWKVRPVEAATVIARFHEGDPALVEKTHGAGRILVFTSSLGRVWSDFPLRSPYVPFWYRAVQYVSQLQENPAALRVGQVLPVEEWAADSTPGSSRTWNVLDPKGQRVIALDAENPRYLRLQLPGHYEIRSNRATDWVAVNPEPGESNLERVPAEEFEAALSVRRRTVGPETTRVGRETEETGQPLWWLFLAAAALVLLAESMVANRIGLKRSSRLVDNDLTAG